MYRAERLQHLLDKAEDRLKVATNEKDDLLVLCEELETQQADDREQLLALEEKYKECEMAVSDLKKMNDQLNAKKNEFIKSKRC